MRKKMWWLKTFFLALAAGLTLFLFMYSEKETASFTLEAPEFNNKAISNNMAAATTMVAPRYLGEDGENRRWEVTADRAIQMYKDGEEYVKLENLSAYATMEKGDRVTFKAGEGLFDRDDAQLSLTGNVEINIHGYVLKTSNLVGSLETKTAKSDTSVTIEGAGANIKGGNFSLEKGGKILKLTNGVKAKLWPKQLESNTK